MGTDRQRSSLQGSRPFVGIALSLHSEIEIGEVPLPVAPMAVAV